MSNFFKSCLSAFIAAILGTIAAFIFLYYIIFSFFEEKEIKHSIKDNSILVISSNYEYKDNQNNDLNEIKNKLSLRSWKKLSLSEIIQTIKYAQNDKRIKFIVLNADYVPSSFAAISQIRKALEDFKKSGKYILAYSNFYSLKAYYLSSVADKIYLNPSGYIEWNGLLLSRSYYKRLFDKIGIQAQIFKSGKLKSAPDQYSSSKMSDDEKKIMTEFLYERWFDILFDIALYRTNILSQKVLFNLHNLSDSTITTNSDLQMPDYEYIPYLKESYRENFLGHATSEVKDYAKILNVNDDFYKSIIHLDKIANENPAINAYEAYQLGFVDGIKYYDEFLTELEDSLKLPDLEKKAISLLPFISRGNENEVSLTWFEKDNMINIEYYYEHIQSSEKDNESENKIAIVFVEGEIYDIGYDEDGVNGEVIASIIRNLRLDKNIKAIVLRVNSPGGSAFASELIAREVELAAKSKPVIVSMGSVAASGGYYIATPSSNIFAEEFTITGSIGVFAIVPHFNELLKDKLGIDYDQIKTNKYSDLPTFYRPLNKEESQILQKEIDNIYKTFIERVSKGRKISLDSAQKLGDGRIYSARKAKELNLIDFIGGLEKAIQMAAKMADLKDYRIVKYPSKKVNISKYIDLFAKFELMTNPQDFNKKSLPLMFSDKYNRILALCEIMEE